MRAVGASNRAATTTGARSKISCSSAATARTSRSQSTSCCGKSGFASDDLRVAITWDRNVNDYHAVTVVRLDGEVYILDVDGGPRRSQNDYRFLFSINETGIWDHKETSAGSAQRDKPTDYHYSGEQHI